MPLTPQQQIDAAPMSPAQIIVTLLGVLLFALDGFDVMAISFAAPGIANEWGINRAALGVVLSMELIGMSVGSILIGGLADKYGRRTSIFACLLIMGGGMGLTAMAEDVTTLSLLRFITGIGIGGLLPAVASIVPEFANNKHRAMLVSFAASGFSLGTVLGGMVVTELLQVYSWRSIFVFGAIVTLLSIPLVYFLLPESIAFLCQSHRRNALSQVNQVLVRLRLSPVEALPELPKPKNEKQLNWLNLFKGNNLIATVCLSLMYLGHMMTFYFIVKWTPKIVVDMGYPAAQAGGVLIWVSVGGFLGSLLFGTFTRWISPRNLTLFMLLMSIVSIIAFGNVGNQIDVLSVIAFIAGLFTTSAIAGFYTLMADAFSTDVRAGGTGFVIGVGRTGAAISPIMAGILFAAGSGLSSVAFLMACGSVLAILSVLTLVSKQRSAAAEADLV